MCGIAAFFGLEPVRQDVVEGLFRHILPRGREAAGIAMFRDGLWTTAKMPGSVDKNMASFVDLVTEYEPTSVLLHTRLPSGGSPSDNNNNHPIVCEHSFILHNGVVDVPEHYDGKGKTDTEQMGLHFEKQGLIKGLETVSGWYANMRVDLERPYVVQIFRNSGAPLQVYKGDGYLIYASTAFRSNVDRGWSTEMKAGIVYAVDPRKLEPKAVASFNPKRVYPQYSGGSSSDAQIGVGGSSGARIMQNGEISYQGQRYKSFDEWRAQSKHRGYTPPSRGKTIAEQHSYPEEERTFWKKDKSKDKTTLEESRERFNEARQLLLPDGNGTMTYPEDYAEEN